MNKDHVQKVIECEKFLEMISATTLQLLFCCCFNKGPLVEFGYCIKEKYPQIICKGY